MEDDQFENFLQRVFSESYCADTRRKFTEAIPQNINGDFVFILNPQNRLKLLKNVGVQDHGSVIVKLNGKT